jgi:Pex14 N-terminal domain
MPDEKKDVSPDPSSPSTSKEPPSTLDIPVVPSPALSGNTNDRQDLVNKARTFLASPQVRNEDIPAKRRFLAEKGLTDVEIDRLI